MNVWSLDSTYVSCKTSGGKMKFIRICMRRNNFYSTAIDYSQNSFATKSSTKMCWISFGKLTQIDKQSHNSTFSTLPHVDHALSGHVQKYHDCSLCTLVRGDNNARAVLHFNGRSLWNEAEAECTVKLCEVLCNDKARVSPTDIGVICPYASQKRHVVEKLKEL